MSKKWCWHLPSLIVAGLVSAAVGTAARAQAVDFARAFGSREAVSNLRLSPDATRISYLSPMKNGGSALVVTDLATGKSRPLLTSTVGVMWISRCQWVKVDRLICYVGGISDAGAYDLGFQRVVSIDAAGKGMKMLGQRNSVEMIGYNQYSGAVIASLPDNPNEVMMQTAAVPEQSTGTRLAKTEEGLGTSFVDVYTGRRRKAETARSDAGGFIADTQGRARILERYAATARGYTRRDMTYLYRAKTGNEWLPLAQVDLSATHDLEIEGVDETGDWVYALMPKDGRQALYKLAIDGSGRQQLVYAHPKVDVTGVLRIGKYNRPVAATYVLDGNEFEFFDPELAKLSRTLSKALGGKPVFVLDESWDGMKKLIYVGTDLEPGRYYLFDSQTKQLQELLGTRPQLDGMKLAPMQTVYYPARDQVAIPAYLTLPPTGASKGLPAIIMPHGGPSARDQWGFDWLSQYFAQLGYAVLQANFRGSAGYGEAWFQTNGVQSWQTAVGDINDGAKWLVSQGIADPKRIAIVGWSYGGYASLQGSVVEPDLYKAVVAIAPVTDWGMIKTEAMQYTNYRLVADFVGNGPHVVAGSPAKNAARIKAPVLMFHGDRDLNVNIAHSNLMRDALTAAGRPPELVVYKNLDHSLDDSDTRADLLRRSAAFLEDHLRR